MKITTLDQFRISKQSENKFYVERYETERHELECHNGAHWMRITPYYNSRAKCQQFIDGMNPRKLSTIFYTRPGLIHGRA